MKTKFTGSTTLNQMVQELEQSGCTEITKMELMDKEVWVEWN